jgi:hypothetical protein
VFFVGIESGKERASMKVYIDGENFVHCLLHALRRKQHITHRNEIKAFDLAGLCREALGTDDVSILYYTTKLKAADAAIHGVATAKKSKEMIAWVSGWHSMLVEQGITVVRAGNLQIRETFPCPSCGHTRFVFQEKGVDVRLAIDLVSEASQGAIQVIFSSDSDMIPAVRAARVRGARIKNLASSEAINKGMMLACSEWQKVTDDQFVAAYDRAQKKGKK